VIGRVNVNVRRAVKTSPPSLPPKRVELLPFCAPE
jgi:hypothetical protein